MIDDDTRQRLTQLWSWVAAYDPDGRTYRQFWADFEAELVALDGQDWDKSEDPELAEFWMSIVGFADDRGFFYRSEDADKSITGEDAGDFRGVPS